MVGKGWYLLTLKTGTTKRSYKIYMLRIIISYSSVSIALKCLRIGNSNKVQFWSALNLIINSSYIQLIKSSTLLISSSLLKENIRWLGEKSTGKYGPLSIFSCVANVIIFTISVNLKDVKHPPKNQNTTFIVLVLKVYWMRSGKIITFNYLMNL